MDIKNLSSNWKKLQASGILQKNETVRSTSKQKVKPSNKASQDQQKSNRKRKRPDASQRHLSSPNLSKRKRTMSTEHLDVYEKSSNNSHSIDPNVETKRDRINEGLAPDIDPGKYVALDCEMVGVGPNPDLESALARVSMVDYNGEQIYDSYVRPQEEVTDWRTHVSGIQPKHMVHARSFDAVQSDVAALMKGRIVVGHSLRSDFEALMLDHPKRDVRDTARHPPYRRLAGGVSPKLKVLASELLGLEIQDGEHSSVEDARATMLLFRRDKDAFEKEHIKKWGAAVAGKKTDGENVDEKSSQKPKKKKKKKK